MREGVRPGGGKNGERGTRVHLHAVSCPSPAFLQAFATQATEFIRKPERPKKLIDTVECSGTDCIGVIDTDIFVRN